MRVCLLLLTHLQRAEAVVRLLEVRPKRRLLEDLVRHQPEHVDARGAVAGPSAARAAPRRADAPAARPVVLELVQPLVDLEQVLGEVARPLAEALAHAKKFIPANTAPAFLRPHVVFRGLTEHGRW